MDMTILVIGSVTSSHYARIRRQMNRKGIKPIVKRLDIEEWNRNIDTSFGEYFRRSEETRQERAGIFDILTQGSEEESLDPFAAELRNIELSNELMELQDRGAEKRIAYLDDLAVKIGETYAIVYGPSGRPYLSLSWFCQDSEIRLRRMNRNLQLFEVKGDGSVQQIGI